MTIVPNPEQATFLNHYQSLPKGQFAVIESDTYITSPNFLDQLDFLIQHQLIPVWIIAQPTISKVPSTLSNRVSVEHITYQQNFDDLLHQCILAIDSNRIPIISLPESVNQLDFIGSFVTAGAIHKWIYIHDQGPLRDANQQPVSFINLTELTTNSIQHFDAHHDRLLTYFNLKLPFCAMALTNANDLVNEVFTVKGAGTYIAFHQVDYILAPSDSILYQCASTIESSFSKTLHQHYLNQSFAGVITQTDFQGCILFQNLTPTLIYLDKFAVLQLYRGTGLGKRLWLKLTSNHQHIIWRANHNNPMNDFYQLHATYKSVHKEWIIYGIGDPELFQEWAPKVALKPSSFLL